MAIASHSSAVLAISWPQPDTKDLLGFAIRRTGPDGKPVFLETLLCFPGDQHQPGQLFPSNVKPIQMMVWTDQRLQSGVTYTYEVFPWRNRSGPTLDVTGALKTTVTTDENGAGNSIEMWFNSASWDSQDYVDLFGDVNPTDDVNGPAARWLAAGLDDAIIGFIDTAAKDPALSLDLAAYHLDHPGVIAAICRVGKRARVSLDFIAQKGKTKKANPTNDDFVNGPALQQLEQAGVNVHKRTKGVAISHNKYIILKDGKGQPQSVLTGSTNFTKTGIITQANVSLILHDPKLAACYLQDFEHVYADDTPALRTMNETWFQGGADDGSAVELNFSPHKTGSRKDLDHYVEITKAAKESIFFATFSLTDPALIDAVAAPPQPIISRGVVDQLHENGKQAGTSESPLLKDAFDDADPSVVVAVGFTEHSSVTRVEHVRRGPVDIFVHHKMILVDYGLQTSALIVGSANYSKNSSQHNDENTLVIRGNHRVAQRFLVNFFRMFQHYHSRWLVKRAQNARAAAMNPDALPPDEAVDGAGTSDPRLEVDASWSRRYYDGSDESRLLDLFLRDAPDSAAARPTRPR